MSKSKQHWVATFAGVWMALLVGLPAAARAQTETFTVQGPLPRIMFVDNVSIAQTWTARGSDAGFDIVDTTVGRTIFHLDRAAPANAIYVESTGDVGNGTNVPEYPLHVLRTSAGAARIAYFQQTKTNGLVLVGIENFGTSNNVNEAGFDFVLRTTTARRVASRIVSGLTDPNDASRLGRLRFLIATGGLLSEAMRIQGTRVGINNANPTTFLNVVNANCNGTTWNNACSRTLKHDIADLSPASARETVMALRPVTYAYNQDPADQRVGFIAEEAPDLVAMPDRQSLSSMDIVAVMAKVMQEQEREITALRTQLGEQRQSFEERLQALEARDGPTAGR